MHFKHHNSDDSVESARRKLEELSSKIAIAQTRVAETPPIPETLINRSFKKSISSYINKINITYRSSKIFFYSVEKSPFVRLILAVFFLITVLSVSLQLNDRNLQIEIAAWDLFEKTKPGTPQNNRAANLLVAAGATLDELTFGEKSASVDIDSITFGQSGLKPATQSFDWNFRSDVFVDYCQEKMGKMNDVDFGPTRKWSLLPPNIETRLAQLNKTEFNCLDISGIFEQAKLEQSQFNASRIHDSNFAGSDLSFSKNKHLKLKKVIFKNSDLENAEFSYSTFEEVDFSNAKLVRGEIENSIIFSANFDGANLFGLNISGTRFVSDEMMKELYNFHRISAEELSEPNRSATLKKLFLPEIGISALTQEQLSRTWAWADNPPIGLDLMDPPLSVGILCERGFILDSDLATQLEFNFAEFKSKMAAELESVSTGEFLAKFLVQFIVSQQIGIPLNCKPVVLAE